MDIKQLKREVTKDLKIDDVQLDYASLEIPRLFTKYQNMLLDIKGDLQSAMEARDRIVKRRNDYYLGRAEDKVYVAEPLDHKVMKSELDIYMKADELVIEANSVVKMYSNIADYLEQVMWDINRRNGYIKNAIEWRKFNQGVC